MMNLGLKQLGSNTLLTLSRKIVTSLFGFLIIVLIARLLGPEGNGIYQMVILLSVMVVTLSNLGIGPATVYYVARKDYSVETVVKGNIILGLVVGSFASLIALITVMFFSEILFPGIPRTLLLTVLIITPVSLLMSYMLTVFQGLQDFKSYSIISLVPQAVMLIIIIIVLWVFGGGVIFAVLAYMFGNMLALIMSLLCLKKHLNFSIKYDNCYIKDVLNYGWKAHISNIMAFLNYRLDMLLVNGLLNPVAVGLYSITVQIAERLWILSQAVSTVLLPRISELKDEEDSRRVITPLICRWVLMISTLGSLVLFLVTPYIFPLLFGNEYFAAIAAFQILLPGIVLGSASRILANDLAARGRPEINMILSFFSIVLNVIGNLTFIPIMGINGAALATTISYGINTCLKAFFYSRVSKVKWYKPFLPEKRDFTILVAVIKKEISMKKII